MKLPNSVIFAIRRLENAGFEVFLVGGCVRDTLMGKEPHDYDLTTNALPNEIQSVFADCKTLDYGAKHGTVTLVYEGEQIEITTYRTEGNYKDHRHPDNVAFTRDLILDLSRRDFTINAMAYNPNSGFTDPFGGQKDLSAKKIVCVGDAKKRLDEDALRILRALRFSSVLDFDIDKDTETAIREKESLLKLISKERIREEFSKLLCGVRAMEILQSYASVFRTFLSEMVLPERFPEDADLYTRLALLFSAEETLKMAMKRLTYSNDEIKQALRKFRFLATGSDCFDVSDLNITGGELIALSNGSLKGKDVGENMNRLLRLVQSGKVQNEKNALIKAFLESDIR